VYGFLKRVGKGAGQMNLVPATLAWPLAKPASWTLAPDASTPSDLAAALRENAALRNRVKTLEALVHGSAHPNHHRVIHNASTLLTRERLLEVTGPSRQIILTFVNKARLDFAVTWAAHLRRIKLTNWLVGATDHDALVDMLEAGTPCFSMTTKLPEGEWSWGSPSFHSLGPHKIELIHQTVGSMGWHGPWWCACGGW
jgi:hypothetical protein